MNFLALGRTCFKFLQVGWFSQNVLENEKSCIYKLLNNKHLNEMLEAGNHFLI